MFTRFERAKFATIPHPDAWSVAGVFIAPANYRMSEPIGRDA
jgi:hypothetical protein